MTQADSVKSSDDVTDARGSFRVVSLVADNETFVDGLTSDVAVLGAVDPTAHSLAAERDVDAQPDLLEATWMATGNDSSEWRVVASFDEGKTWHIIKDSIRGGTRSLEVALTDTDGGTGPGSAFEGMETVDGKGAGPFSASLAQVNGAFMLRVDALQRPVSATNPWRLGTAITVAAKGSG